MTQRNHDDLWRDFPRTAGKDVVWVPTPQVLVERMLDMAKVTSHDYVIDLGSGDGRTVITAAKRGAKALGIEYNPKMVEVAKRSAARAGVADRAMFVEADIFASDFSQATVLTLFLLPQLNLRLRPTILNMQPGTRVVSNSFDMGNWQPDETVEVLEDCANYCRALLWIVPANVEGSCQLEGARSPGRLPAARLAGPLHDADFHLARIVGTAGDEHDLISPQSAPDPSHDVPRTEHAGQQLLRQLQVEHARARSSPDTAFS